MRIHHIITFIVDKEKGNTTDGKLRMRVRWGKDNRVAANLGYRVSLAKWSSDAQRCKANTTHGKDKVSASEINAEIERYNRIAEETFECFESWGKEPTIEEYRKALKERLGRKVEQSDSAIGIIARYLAEKEVRASSKREIGHLLKRYDKAVGETMILEKGSLEKYRASLLDRGLANRTINTNVSIISTFLEWAVSKGYCKDTGLVPTYLEQIDKTVVWLSWEELMSLYNFKFKGIRNDIRRDIFCFSCFTGLRRSDIMNLTWSKIQGDTIYLSTIKTHKPIVIELNKYSRAILEKRRAVRYDDYVFPHDMGIFRDRKKSMAREAGLNRVVTIQSISGQKVTEEEMPLWKALTLHCGRRTFVCNALQMGIPPHVVMSWTGHSSFEAMRPYIDIASQEKTSAMKNFDRD